MTRALAYSDYKQDLVSISLIEDCVAQNRAAQEKLYKLLYPKMMSMVRRYFNHDKYEQAEEIMNNGFLRVFQKIDTYKFEGSFEGWVRKIIYHSISDYVRQNIKYMEKTVMAEKDVLIDNNIAAKFGYDEIMKLVQQLPEATRTVFNLYVMEGFGHKDISDMLSISEGTSKWHLFEARKILKNKITIN